jgi:hypothetical protein
MFNIDYQQVTNYTLLCSFITTHGCGFKKGIKKGGKITAYKHQQLNVAFYYFTK